MITIGIDFGGFYYSVHSQNIDWQIETQYEWEFDVSGVQAGETLAQFEDKVNWKSTYIDYGKNYINRLNNHFDLELEFVGIDSPKYYNYRTDLIVVNVGDVDEVRIHNNLIDDDDFKSWADPQLTSYDGFTSFYDGIDGLIKESKQDYKSYGILLRMMVEYLIWRDSINEEIHDLEYEVIYNE